MPMYSSVFIITFWSCFKVLGLMLKSLFYFELILVYVIDGNLVSVFYMCMSSFPSKEKQILIGEYHSIFVCLFVYLNLCTLKFKI
jgi:hypothetical protein